MRAIAVLAVVLYHLQFPFIPGGFVGVDVFFTISGYLIGSIVFAQLGSGSFSVTDFYYRRLKRLFPAYAVVVLATLAASWYILLPADFVGFGKSILATSVYLSNVLFYLEAGYFDVGSKAKPLLHTWSLGVEEQFYLVFPALALLAWRFLRERVLVFFSLAALVSFGLATTYMSRDPSAVFFLHPFRAWEMFLGVMLAAVRFDPPRSRSVSLGLAILGMVAIAVPMLTYNSATPFPGMAALPVCLGTALLIYACSSTNAMTKALSRPVPVFFGRISYSLYLWHWPIVVLYTYTQADDLSLPEQLSLLTVSIALAVFSWRFVETPFRMAESDDQYKARKRTFLAVGVTSLALFSVGYTVWKSEGAPNRLDPMTAELASISADFFKDWTDCYDDDNNFLPGVEFCALGHPMQSEDYVLIWGDSHAFAFHPGMKLFFDRHGLDAIVAWRGGCPPVWDIDKDESVASAIEDEACTKQNDQIKRLVNGENSISGVVLIGRWSYYINGAGLGIDARNRIELSTRNDDRDMFRSQSQLFLKRFSQTVAELNSHGLKPFIVEQAPEFPYLSSRDIARGVFSGQLDYDQTMRDVGDTAYETIHRRQNEMNTVLGQLSASESAVILNTHRYFCGAERCRAELEGTLAYFDNNHLAGRAAEKLENIFLPVAGGLISSQERNSSGNQEDASKGFRGVPDAQ
jgi:peptidoglycan/LPS O-acetylase OafA/YrhL